MARRARSKKRLDKMHVWVHRRFHDASGKYWLYWLEVRTRILELIAQQNDERKGESQWKRL